MSKESIIGKIEKLLAIANDGAASEGEVQNALAMVQKLMAKHALEEGDLKFSKKTKPVIYTTVDVPRAYAWYQKQAMKLIADNFRVFVFYGKSEKNYYGIYGFEEDSLIAKQVMEFVGKNIEKHLRIYVRDQRREVSQAEKNDWTRGFLGGLREVLTNQVHKHGWALVVQTPKEVMDHVNDIGTFRQSKKTPRIGLEGNSGAILAGYQAGKETQLYNQIDQKKKSK